MSKQGSKGSKVRGFARCGSTVRGFHGFGFHGFGFDGFDAAKLVRSGKRTAKRVPVRYDGRATAGENVSHGGSERA